VSSQSGFEGGRAKATVNGEDVKSLSVGEVTYEIHLRNCACASVGRGG